MACEVDDQGVDGVDEVHLVVDELEDEMESLGLELELPQCDELE